MCAHSCVHTRVRPQAHMCVHCVRAHVQIRVHACPSRASPCVPGAHIPRWLPPNPRPLPSSRGHVGAAVLLTVCCPCIRERPPETGWEGIQKGSHLPARPERSFPKRVKQSEAKEPAPESPLSQKKALEFAQSPGKTSEFRAHNLTEESGRGELRCPPGPPRYAAPAALSS